MDYQSVVALTQSDAEGPAASASRPLLYSSWTVGCLVALVYGTWLVFMAASGHDARDFILLNRTRILMSHTSTVIKLDSDYARERQPSHGYDGQFAYFIALDPLNARYYMPDPAYRYTRILYPAVARTLALGNPSIVPVSLILVNLVAIAAGTVALAAWFMRSGLSSWLALVYGLYPGLFVGLRRDLTEPLAYGLVVIAIYLLYYGGRRRLFVAGVVLGLAALTREQVAIFGVVFGLALLFLPGGWRRDDPWIPKGSRWSGLFLLAMTLGPLLLYKAFLLHWLGSTGTPSNNFPSVVPFGGFLSQLRWTWDKIVSLPTVVVPGILCLSSAVYALTRLRSPLLWLLAANVLLFVVFLNHSSYASYISASRVSTGVVLSGLLCLPVLRGLDRWTLTSLRLSIPLWLGGWLAFPAGYLLHPG